MSGATTPQVGDSSLAARELSFLVRLAQAAAATSRPDELSTDHPRGTSAWGRRLLALLADRRGRELLLTATNGLTSGWSAKS